MMSDNILNVPFELSKVTNEQFLTAIFGEDLTGVYVTGFKTDPSSEVTPRERSQMWLGNCYEEFAKEYLGRNFNTFFCISTFHRAKDDSRYRRRTNLVNKTHVIMVDDVGPKIKEKDLKLSPSYKLETSPGNSQCGYILRSGEGDNVAVNQLIDALIKYGLNVDTDPGMAGVNRYARLPVGTNNKSAYGEPFNHRLREWHPTLRYSLDDIAEAYGIRLHRSELERLKQQALKQDEDEILRALKKEGLLKGENPAKPGCYDIICPWLDEHTGAEDSGSAYFIPGYLDAALQVVYTDGGFECHHGHCRDRHLTDVVYELNNRGYPVRHPALLRAFSDAHPEDDDWTKQLEVSPRSNRVRTTCLNCEIILANDPATKGAIRYDELRQMIVCVPALPWHKGDHAIRNMDRPDLRSLISQTYAVEFSLQTVWEAVQTLANRNRYDGLSDYLKGLQWDGRERLSTWLVEHAGAEDTPYVRGVSRLTCLGAVARALEPGVKFDYMCILEGTQGIGKSEFLAALVPKEEWYTDLDVDVTNRLKEAVAEIQGRWIVEMGELSAMKRSGIYSFKRFITRRNDNIRLAYRYDVESYPRRCIFIGTTNEAQYLEDLTGNRRFWPVRCSDEFDISGLRRNRNQLWAEAVQAYYDGEQFYPDKAFEKLCMGEQEHRRTKPAWEDPIYRYLEDKDQVTIEEICSELLYLNYSDLRHDQTILIAKLICAQGFKHRRFRIDGKRTWGYRRAVSRGTSFSP